MHPFETSSTEIPSATEPITADPITADPIAAAPPSASHAPSARRSTLPAALRDPRHRLLLGAAAALLLLLLVVGVWYGNPTNRTRRDLARANANIIDKQREVDDARRLLAEKIAELRAAHAEADVQATRYQAALDRATKPVIADSVSVGGEVIPGGAPITPVVHP